MRPLQVYSNKAFREEAIVVDVIHFKRPLSNIVKLYFDVKSTQ